MAAREWQRHMSLSFNDLLSRSERPLTFGTDLKNFGCGILQCAQRNLADHAREQCANSPAASFVVRLRKWTATLPASEERAMGATMITIILVANYESLAGISRASCPSILSLRLR